MTMTTTEIDHTAEIGHIVEIDHETTTEMTIEKKIIGISKTGDTELDIEIIMKTHVMTGS